jgi:hypothetical protein
VTRSNGFTLRHEGQQGGAGLQSSGRAVNLKVGFTPTTRKALVHSPTACADSVAQSPPCEVRSSLRLRASSLQKAKKKLIATHANSEIHATHSKRTHITISNRNTILCFVIRRGNTKRDPFDCAQRLPAPRLRPAPCGARLRRTGPPESGGKREEARGDQ